MGLLNRGGDKKAPKKKADGGKKKKKRSSGGRWYGKRQKVADAERRKTRAGTDRSVGAVFDLQGLSGTGLPPNNGSNTTTRQTPRCLQQTSARKSRRTPRASISRGRYVRPAGDEGYNGCGCQQLRNHTTVFQNHGRAATAPTRSGISKAG